MQACDDPSTILQGYRPIRPSIPTEARTHRRIRPRGIVRRGIPTSIGESGRATGGVGRAIWEDCQFHRMTTTKTTTTIQGRRARPSPSTTRKPHRRVPRRATPPRRILPRRIRPMTTEIPERCIAPRTPRYRTTTARRAGDVRPLRWIPCKDTWPGRDPARASRLLLLLLQEDDRMTRKGRTVDGCCWHCCFCRRRRRIRR